MIRYQAIGVLIVSAMVASPANARDGAMYIELNGGVAKVNDSDYESSDYDIVLNPDAAGTIDWDLGYDFGAILGYDFGTFRLEAEASVRGAEINEVSTVDRALSGEQINGDFTSRSLMLNGVIELGQDGSIQPFIGGGAGIAKYKITDRDFSDTASDSGFAWQLLAGLRAPLTRNIDVGLKYRFFNHRNISANTSADDNDLHTKLSSHSILGMFTYNFGSEAAPPLPPVFAAPTPPPPPPVIAAPMPPPSCNKGPYIVFFGWDQSDITPEAATILDNAISAYRNCGTVAVMLAGHTDSSGTKVYNEGLAQRRNSSVRAYLIGRGLAGTRISSESFGETKLRVPTADGIRELQNRRVEVTYGPGSGL